MSRQLLRLILKRSDNVNLPQERPHGQQQQSGVGLPVCCHAQHRGDVDILPLLVVGIPRSPEMVPYALP